MRTLSVTLTLILTVVAVACSGAVDPLNPPVGTADPAPIAQAPTASPTAEPVDGQSGPGQKPTPVTTPEPMPQPARPAPEPTPTPNVHGVPAAPDADLEALRTELATLAQRWPGKNAIAVTDLQTGQTISINGSRPQLAACSSKWIVIMAVAQDIEAGRYRESDVAALVQSAMGPSNNPPLRELLDLVGSGDIGSGLDRVNRLMWQLGAKHSILTHPPGYPWEEYGYLESHGSDENLITAEDMNLLLGKLLRGEALSPWSTRYVLRAMTIAPDWMDASLGSALPDKAKLYHKIGQLYEPESTWNDVGLVVFERDGQSLAYAISFLGSYNGSWQEAYSHAQRVSAIVWDHFDNKYQES